MTSQITNVGGTGTLATKLTGALSTPLDGTATAEVALSQLVRHGHDDRREQLHRRDRHDHGERSFLGDD